MVGIFSSDAITREWRTVEDKMALMDIPKAADSVNPGDRRALYYLVRHLRPRSVLEIGTHLGASTVHIAAALRLTQQDDAQTNSRVTTVDIKDMNDQATMPWLEWEPAIRPPKWLGASGSVTGSHSSQMDRLTFWRRARGGTTSSSSMAITRLAPFTKNYLLLSVCFRLME